jgi:hypothetical protein
MDQGTHPERAAPLSGDRGGARCFLMLEPPSGYS